MYTRDVTIIQIERFSILWFFYQGGGEDRTMGILSVLRAIRQKKRTFTILFLSFLIGTVVIFLSIYMLNRAENRIYDFYADIYGKQHACFFDLSDEDEETLKSFSNLDIGFFANYGSFETADGKAALTLGYYSEEAMNVGHIKLLEGEWPETKDQIVLSESFALYSLEEPAGIGDTVSFAMGGEQRTFTVTGIMSTVDSWETSFSYVVTSGYNDYPSGVMTLDESLDHTKNFLIYDRSTTSERFFMDISALYRKLQQKRDELMAINQNLYCSVYEDILRTFSSFKRTILFVLLLSFVLILSSIVNIAVAGYSESIRRYRMLGASRLFIMRIIDAQIGTAMMLSFLTALVLAIPLYQSLSFILAMIALVAVFVILNFILVIDLREKKVKRSRQGNEVRFRRSVPKLLYDIFGKRNLPKMIPNVIILALIISAFILASFYGDEVMEKMTVEGYDFKVYNATGGSNILDGFWHWSLSTMSMSTEKAVDIYGLSGIDSVRIEYRKGVMIVSDPQPSKYWKEYGLIQHGPGSSEAMVKVEGMRTEAYMTIPEFTIIVVTDDLVEKLKEKMPGFPLSAMKENGSVCIYAPPVSSDEGYCFEDLFSRMGTITFGRLDETVVDDPGKIKEGYGLKYTEYAFPVEKVYMEDLGELANIEYDLTFSPLVFISEETNGAIGFVKDVWSVYVRLEEDISEEDYQAINSFIIELSRTGKNSGFENKRTRDAQIKEMVSVVKKTLILMAATFGAFSMVAMYIVIYMNIMSKARSFGILRNFGMNKRDLRISLLKETSVYSVAMVIISVLFVLFLFDKWWLIGNLRASMFFGTERIALMIYVCIAVFLPTVLSVTCSEGTFRRSIYETVRFGE